MDGLLVISLIFFGLLAIVMDLLFIPGGVIAILGVLLEIAGVVFAYAGGGSLAGTLTLVITLVISIGVIVLMLRSKTWRKCALDAKIDSKMNEFDENRVHIGAVGQTISRLAPTGKAVFDGETVEVVSAYGLIDENSEVVVDKIDGNKIVVKLI